MIGCGQFTSQTDSGLVKSCPILLNVHYRPRLGTEHSLGLIVQHRSVVCLQPLVADVRNKLTDI